MRACIFTCIDKSEIEFSRLEAVKYNGVDISKNRKTRRVTNFAKKKNEKALINYIVKYVSKSTEGFTHLAWHSSREYSNLIISVRFTVSELQKSNVRSFLDEKPMYENEWCYFYKWKSGTPKEVVGYLSFVNNIALSLLN
jgi:hypothetical protein